METVQADPRLTPQRRAVLGVLTASHDHPSAAEVLARVRRVAPGIGAATVYRSLAHLVASGQAVELSFERGAARYDANTRRHDHLVCDGCGRVRDIEVPADELDSELGRIAQLAAETGFTITAYDLRFRGRCATCAASATPTA